MASWHSFVFDKKQYGHCFACVQWFKEYPNNSLFKNPSSVYYAKVFKLPSPATFIPVQRIQSLVMHDHSRRKELGFARLRVEHNGSKHNFVIVDQKVTPLLGLKSSQSMGLVKIMVSGVDTTDNNINAVPENVSSDSVLSPFADVFQGVGCLPGEYNIQLDKEGHPMVHPPRRVPVPKKKAMKAELDKMVTNKIIVPLTVPTDWVSSVLAVPKKDGSVRICLDPKDLNTAIKRSHYPLPTVDDVTSLLTKAKVLNVMDAKSGFWQVKLSESSSYYTTFNTPFGRFRWWRMPFGISSTPEVWQRKMNEAIQDLCGVEVIADDFLVGGFGDTVLEAIKDHDQNLTAFLQRCRKLNLTLNPQKVKLRMSEVPFMGHLLTADGIITDPNKVRAIKDMSTPTDVKSRCVVLKLKMLSGVGFPFIKLRALFVKSQC